MITKKVHVNTRCLIGDGAYARVLGLAVDLGHLVTERSAYLFKENSVDIDNAPFRVARNPYYSEGALLLDCSFKILSMSDGLPQPPWQFLFVNRLVDWNYCFSIFL
jgi:hypothetical protein